MLEDDNELAVAALADTATPLPLTASARAVMLLRPTGRQREAVHSETPARGRAQLRNLFRWSQPIQSRHQRIVQRRRNGQRL